jgi:hypothetical protein
MDSIKFPIKFDRSGLQKLTEGTTDYYAQLLTISLLTEPMAHPFTPDFGVYDPSFTGVDRGLFILRAAQFVPEVEITAISVDEKANGTSEVAFSFAIKGLE